MVLRRIADPDARQLVVFGSGPQARAHILAVRSIRSVDSLIVVGRQPASVSRLCRQLALQGIDASAGNEDAVADADIVVCATTAATPVFDERRLGEQVSVVAVGSHTPDAREVDDATFRAARIVIVEHRATAFREAGDVIQDVDAGALVNRRLIDLGNLDDRRFAPGPGIAVYKSVSMAYQDLAVATAALRTNDATTHHQELRA